MKIVSYDIETAPSLGHFFDLWKEGNIVATVADWYILSWSVKYLGGKQITRGLCDYPTFKKDKTDDRELVTDLWKIFNEADILIAHNGDRFDRRKSNTRFIKHNLAPPEPYKTVDTLKVARRNFAFNSNRLDDLGASLGVGRKTKHPGIDMWLGCMTGDPASWSLMKKYNKQDVILLEKIYLKLLPWIDNHPYLGTDCNCSSPQLQKRGFGLNKRGPYQRLQCVNCKAWSSQVIKLT